MGKAKSKKGVAGTNTGGAARKAIVAKKKGGCTTKAIAKAAKRDPSTINSILTRKIKNPPANLVKNVRKTVCRKPKK